jgi:hypothetical protein
MRANSHEFPRALPTACAHCGQPFPMFNALIQCWRSSDGRYFCNEFCADDAEEAAFQSRTRKQ